MKRIAISLALGAMLLSSCAGSSLVLAGESMRFPEPPPQMLTFVVLGADDLTPVTAGITTLAETVATDAAGTAELLWEDKPIDVTVGSMRHRSPSPRSPWRDRYRFGSSRWY